jgi:hypothetical protein
MTCNHSYAQVDTLSEISMVLEKEAPLKSQLFPKQYGPKQWKFMLGLDARRSFFKGEHVKINGLRIGLEYKGAHRFGIGVYGLSKNAVFTNTPVDHPAATDNSRVRFNVGYASIFYERVLFKSPKWEFAIPTEFSAGTISGSFEDTSGVFLPLVESPFSALSVGFQAKYYVFSWLAPNASVGYRLTFNTHLEVKGAFNRPYYSFGVQILLGELYRAVFKKEEE